MPLFKPKEPDLGKGSSNCKSAMNSTTKTVTTTGNTITPPAPTTPAPFPTPTRAPAPPPPTPTHDACCVYLFLTNSCVLFMFLSFLLHLYIYTSIYIFIYLFRYLIIDRYIDIALQEAVGLAEEAERVSPSPAEGARPGFWNLSNQPRV